MPYPFGPPPMDPLGMPPQAPAPIPPRNVAQDPRQQLLTIATLGAMLGAGPKSGVATGMGHGLVQGQQELQHLTDYHAQVVAHQQEQIAEQQRQAQAESDRRANTIKGVIQNLQEQGRKAPDIETFQQIATDGAAFLSNAVGMRGVTPQSVAQMMGTFVPPQHEKKFTDAWDEWNSNPSNKTLLEADPSQAIKSEVKVKIGKGQDGSAIYATMPLGELADRAGHGFASVNGQPVAVAKKAATGQYQHDKVLVDGRVTDVLVNPTPGAESHVFGLDGKPIDASRVTAFVPSDGAASDANYTLHGKGIVAVRNRSGRIMYQGQDVTDQVTPYVAPKSGEGEPAPIQPGSREDKIAHDLADGKLTWQQFTRMYAYSRDVKAKQNIYLRAGDINPNFNPAQFEMGYKFASNPKTQNQMASINNVLSGVPDLVKVSDQAKRMGATILNNAVIRGGIAMGGKRYSNFNTARIAFADELSGALGYGSATDMSREMGFNMTDPNLSPENFRSAIEDIVVPFVNRKKASLLGQMGPYGASDSNQSGTSGNTDLDAAAAILRNRGR